MRRPAKPVAPRAVRLAQIFVIALLVCSSFLLSHVARPSPSPQSNPSATRLAPGKPIEKELAGAASDFYEIESPAGQFLHVTVEQIGIDVALTLYSPTGKEIASMDSPNGAFGPEQISAIADSPGLYRLKISSGNPLGPAGRYRIYLDPLRPPTDLDRTRIQAERKTMEAASMPLSNAASRRQVAQKYEDVLPLWHAAGDGYEEALTLLQIGEINFSLGNASKALDCWQRALPLYRAAHDSAGEAAALANIALAFDSLGDKPKALDFDSQALPVARAAGNHLGEASILSNMGSLYDDLGDKQKALDYFDQALALRRAAHDRDEEAETLNNIGQTYISLGQERKALDYLEQGLALVRAANDHYGEAVTLANLGLAHKKLGEMQKAIDCYSRSVALLHEAGDKSAEAIALNNVGKLYAQLGQPQKALSYYQQALPLQQAAGDRFGQARSLHSIGLAYDDLGDSKRALDYFEQALPLHRSVQDRSGEASTLDSIGAVWAARGDREKALDDYNQALLLDQAVGDRSAEASVLNSVGAIYALLGQPQQALDRYSRALALAREVQSPLLEAGVLNNLMALSRESGQPAAAIFFGKQAIDKYQQLRANIRSFESETQRAFVKSKEQAYRALADLLISQGRLPEAQHVLDLLKDEQYFEFIRRDEKNSASSTAPVAFTKAEEASNRDFEANASRVTSISNEWAALRSKPNRTEEEEKRFRELSEQVKSANEAWGKFLGALYAEMGKSRAAQATVEDVQERASGMQRIVRRLTEQSHTGVVALYTLVGDTKYHVILVTPALPVAREYPISADDLRKKIFAFRESLTDPNADPLPQAQELYKILVAPIDHDLAGIHASTLMWSLDDVLRYLPIAALHDGHEYLVEKYRNEVFTPASEPSLAERPSVSSWTGLAMGVSKSYGDFSPLPSVPEELRRIVRDSPSAASTSGDGVLSGQTLLDETFTETNMKKALERDYPVIHIASHFDFAPGNETDSFLLLGGKDPTGGRLTLAEIRNDPAFNFADTQLLTLSACNTALGAASGDGREIDGLGILAQQKGARAVVATLWSVHDASTGILMQDFYREWTAHPETAKAEALRQAQLNLLRGKTASNDGAAHGAKSARPHTYSHPYFWAPFILIGNWQ